MTTRPYSTYLRLCAVLFVCGCGGGGSPITDCTDGVDNDGDGLIDQADPGCELNGNLVEAPDPSQCSDGLDNDGDQLVDIADFGCEDAADDEELDPTRACNDGVDNDEDGRIDLEDPGCENPVDDDEFQPAECGDMTDNDGDGRIDYPFDPGCDSSDDANETDDGVRQCSDTIDNDGDMLIDFGQDIGCDSAADNDEFNPMEGLCGPNIEIVDISITAEATDTIDGPLPNELTSDVCNGYGGEFAYTYSVLSSGKALVISTDHAATTLDTVVYVREVCRRNDTELGCNDDSPGAGPSVGGSFLVIPEVEVGTYYIIVDAFGPGSLGSFKLTVEEQTGLHGPCTPGGPVVCAPGLLCQPLHPGDPNTCEFPRCDDGLDNDGDGIIDFPFEPGCISLADNDETGGETLQCANDIDDDGDGLIDYPADPGCDFAADNIEIDECYPGKPVLAFDLVTGATGSTAGDTNLTSGSCALSADAPEDIYTFTVTVPLTSMTITSNTPGTSYDTVLYVRADDCAAGAEVACNNDTAVSITKSTVTFSPVLGETYFVFIDGQWGGAGSYDLDVSGIIAAGGECDPLLTSFICVSGYTCKESVIGAGDFECRLALCNDTIDNDSDTYIDYPNDPGCATPSDDNEDFPNPVTACFNGLDDDGDGFIDFPADAGCVAASDPSEINECIPGVSVTDHLGGTVTGTTVGGTSLMSAVCDTTGTSGTSPEKVYVFNHTRADATLLHFDTAGSGFDTILYIRSPDCGVAGPSSYCNDNISGGTTSRVEITSAAIGYYFAIVDGVWSGSGSFNLTIWGRLPAAAACTPGAVDYLCSSGYACGAVSHTCDPSACNDGIDNDGDGDIDAMDPGCANIDDNTESPDPVGGTQCSDTIDNDADGFIDYPADTGCINAADNTEQNCAHLLCLTGVALTSGCDPCVTSICAVDSYCCMFSWDSICVGEVASVCGLTCPGI